MNKREIKETQLKNLRLLLSMYDYNRSSLADAMGVEVHTIYSWMRRGRISAKKAIDAEVVTGGKITKKMLRPDVDLWTDEPR